LSFLKTGGEMRGYPRMNYPGVTRLGYPQVKRKEGRPEGSTLLFLITLPRKIVKLDSKGFARLSITNLKQNVCSIDLLGVLKYIFKAIGALPSGPYRHR
jgi:hypothetical protein